MSRESIYRLLADSVLILHVGIVIFVVGGLLLVLIGNRRCWAWVNHLWFRLIHLLSIGVVVAESWLGITCPLTSIESWLRNQAGQTSYHTGFIEYWFQMLLFYDAPSWVFTLIYTLFGLSVLWVWWYFPPQKKAKDNS